MYTSALTRTGNSESIAIPKALRERLGVSASMPVELDCPRDGVVVVYFKQDSQQQRLEKLKLAEASNAEISARSSGKPKAVIEDLIEKARKDRIHGDYTL